MMMMAILASVMQSLGLIMPYFEMAKRQGRVIGIGGFATDILSAYRLTV